MINEYLVTYLANVVMVSRMDGAVTPEEEKAIEMIRQGIGASDEEFRVAIDRVENVEHRITPVGRFSDRVRNFEDMLFVAFADKELALPEKTEVLAFAKKIRLSQDQIDKIVSETKRLIKLMRTGGTCSNCGKAVTPDSRFCIHCGSPVS
jgi:hypothetical protein